MGVASKISCVLCAQQYNRNPLQEILDPPLSIEVGTKFCSCLHSNRAILCLGKLYGELYLNYL